MFKRIRNIIRKPIVDRRVKIGRYVPVVNGQNAYYDMKRGGVLVKGYYDKPFSFTTPMISFSPDEFKISHDGWKLVAIPKNGQGE